MISSVLGISSVPPVSAGTTTADFLTWEPSAQASFFETSVSMATAIAAQAKPVIAQCINDWYHADSSKRAQVHKTILEVMPDYGSFHPTTVVLAIIEDACGRYDDS